ncbi:MAG: glycosyltransferase, partial [Allobaculum sp.]|nr:glycosyltransferase [Allobaculum sp.]
VLPETGLNISKEIIHRQNDNQKIKLLWVGRFIPTKKLDFALKILSKLKDRNNYELHIVGWGNNEKEAHYHQMALDLGIDDLCIWHGKIQNQQVQTLMKESDLLIFTSILEGTPHVVLEAISNNLPVICFDLCGQGVIINDKIGWKIPVPSLSEAVDNMIDTINHIYENQKQIYEKAHNCENRKPELSWNFKISQVLDIYKKLLNTKS